MAIEYFQISENDHEMLDQILGLENEVHASRGGGLNYFEAHSFIKYGRVYAALEYDEILGCVYFLRDFSNPGKCYLYEIIVKPSEAGKHIGESLLLTAFADLKESNLRMVEVCVSPSNTKALRIYKDLLGFKVIRTDESEEKVEPGFVLLRKSL